MKFYESKPTPDDTPHPTDELRSLARVIRCALGVVVAYWEASNTLPARHPYRQAVGMLDTYLKRRYRV